MYRLTKEITTDVLYAVISCHIHRSNLHIKWEKRMEGQDMLQLTIQC